jgi:hypothetical protein
MTQPQSIIPWNLIHAIREEYIAAWETPALPDPRVTTERWREFRQRQPSVHTYAEQQ